jgi:putative restriction endonuclease
VSCGNSTVGFIDNDEPSTQDDGIRAGTYETTVHVRAVDPKFRATVIARHDRTCPVSGVDHPGLLDVAHILSWRDYPAYRADLANVLPLSKTHHAAFDRELFTTIGDGDVPPVCPGSHVHCDSSQA